MCKSEVMEKNFKYFKPRQKNDGDVWNINKAYNDCLNHVKGELIVFLQDFIWIPANGLQSFWDLYQIYPTGYATAPGHKYKADLKTVDEFDNRVVGERMIEECNWTYWELNWSSCPAEMMPRFNEEMDNRYGGENVYISWKLDGYICYLDRMNECRGLSQELCGGRPEKWEEFHFNKANDYQKWTDFKFCYNK